MNGARINYLLITESGSLPTLCVLYGQSSAGPGGEDMAKRKIKDIVAGMLTDCLPERDLELFNVEYVKEGREKYLRVYLDKAPDEDGNERYVSVEECEEVSRWLSDALDREDPLEEAYTLEVSSPGLDRPLIHDSDYVRFAGRLVDISLYKPIKGSRQITAELLGRDDGIVRLKGESGEDLEIPSESIARIRLAVVF